jgi:hypothetical protein
MKVTLTSNYFSQWNWQIRYIYIPDVTAFNAGKVTGYPDIIHGFLQLWRTSK